MKKFNIPKISFKKEDLKKTWSMAKMGLTQNAPTIAAGFAVAGVVASIALTIPATKKYLQELDEILQEREDEQQEKLDSGELDPKDAEEPKLTKKDYFVTGIKHYWYVVVVGGLTIGAMILSVKASDKKIKALTVVASAAEMTMGAKDVSIVDIVGPKKAEEINMETDKKLLDTVFVKPSDDFIEHSCYKGNCEMLCLDAMTGRYFYGDPQLIKENLLDFSANLMYDCNATLNEYFDALGIGHLDFGNYIGWTSEGLGRSRFRYSVDYEGSVNGRVTAIFKVADLPKLDWRLS